jgi:hypothetical protein
VSGAVFMNSDQEGKVDTRITAVEVAILAKLGAKVNGVASVVFKDAPFFAEDDAADETFFFAVEKRSAQSSAQGASLPGRTIAMNDFECGNAILLGLLYFNEEAVAGFFHPRHAGFDVQNLDATHGTPNGIVPEFGGTTQLGRDWARFETNRGLDRGVAGCRDGGREGAIYDLIDGVDGFLFAGAAPQNKNARDEMVVGVTGVAALAFVLHDEGRHTDGLSTAATQDSTKILTGGFGGHQDNSFDRFSGVLESGAYKKADEFVYP